MFVVNNRMDVVKSRLMVVNDVVNPSMSRQSRQAFMARKHDFLPKRPCASSCQRLLWVFLTISSLFLGPHGRHIAAQVFLTCCWQNAPTRDTFLAHAQSRMCMFALVIDFDVLLFFFKSLLYWTNVEVLTMLCGKVLRSKVTHGFKCFSTFAWLPATNPD